MAAPSASVRASCAVWKPDPLRIWHADVSLPLLYTGPLPLLQENKVPDIRWILCRSRTASSQGCSHTPQKTQRTSWLASEDLAGCGGRLQKGVSQRMAASQTSPQNDWGPGWEMGTNPWQINHKLLPKGKTNKQKAENQKVMGVLREFWIVFKWTIQQWWTLCFTLLWKKWQGLYI